MHPLFFMLFFIQHNFYGIVILLKFRRNPTEKGKKLPPESL